MPAPRTTTSAVDASSKQAPRGDPDHPVKRVIILGATGSIGTQTLEVLEHLNTLSARGVRPLRYEVVGLAARRNAGTLADAAQRWKSDDAAPQLAISDAHAAGSLIGDDADRCLQGDDAAERLVRETEADIVVAAMVGAAGLPATLAAVELGRDVALANKETLVAAGELITSAAARAGASLLPVDSEHAAAWQCLRAFAGPGYTPPAGPPEGLRRLILTASGGAFRDRTRDEVSDATPEEALAHPTWSMGAKVTLDCATLTNKALELIEAHWLFGLEASRLGVLIHRQSMVHAMVEGLDGALIAQLGPPDMRVPIQTAIAAPDTVHGADGTALDLAALSRLDFAEPDPRRFPVLEVALGVIERGGTAGAVFNAANEAAVEAFLAGRLPFGKIDELTARVTEAHEPGPVRSLEDVLDADRLARDQMDQEISRL